MILHNHDGFSNLDCIKETFFGVITKTLVLTFYKFQLSSFYCIFFVSLQILKLEGFAFLEFVHLATIEWFQVYIFSTWAFIIFNIASSSHLVLLFATIALQSNLMLSQRLMLVSLLLIMSFCVQTHCICLTKSNKRREG